MSTQIPTFQTVSLTLRPLRETDVPILHRIYQMKDVLAYFPSTAPPQLEKVERWISGQEKHWLEHGYGNWGIAPQGAMEIIGWAGLQFLPELDETEVGFLLSPEYWGKGYATEAALAALQFGFERIRLDHIIALVHPDNLASQRVIQKCGMTYLETIPLWGIQLMRNNISMEKYHHVHQ
ncbi:MAG: GNAT family N-acetyltransferase [Anaerolineae bacterium]|nr:GNAT family N-acetyltransferase [Anaerolineae bacterium]